MSTTTAARGEPGQPPTRRRRLRTLVAVAVVGLVLAAIVAIAVHTVHQRQESAMRAAMRAAFPDISDARWDCDYGDPVGGRTAYGCTEHGGDEFAPSVTFIAFDAPVGKEAGVEAVSRRHEELAAEDHSGYHSDLRLLSVDDWTSTAGGRKWGSVSRWWSDYDQPGSGPPVWSARFRYDDKPFGVDVHAYSRAELTDVIDSLTLPDPSSLPD